MSFEAEVVLKLRGCELSALKLDEVSKVVAGRYTLQTIEQQQLEVEVGVLDVCCNKVSTLRGVEDYEGLHTLLLAQNQLSSLGVSHQLAKLLHLDVSQNCLTSLVGIKAMAKLQTLNASSNALTAVHELAACTQLQAVMLSNNGISNLKGLESLSKLQTLLLDGNAIDSMLQLRPLSILPHLHCLKVAGNPLTAKASAQQMRVMLRNIMPGLNILDGCVVVASTSSYSWSTKQGGGKIVDWLPEGYSSQGACSRDAGPEVSLSRRPIPGTCLLAECQQRQAVSLSPPAAGGSPANLQPHTQNVRVTSQVRSRRSVQRMSFSEVSRRSSSQSSGNSNPLHPPFRSLRKIESGTSVDEENLTPVSLARTALAFHPQGEDELDDDRHSWSNSFRKLRKIESGSSVDKKARLSLQSLGSSHLPSFKDQAETRRTSSAGLRPTRGRVSFAGELVVNEDESLGRHRSVSFRRRTEDIPAAEEAPTLEELASDAPEFENHIVLRDEDRQYNSRRSSVSFDPTPQVIEMSSHSGRRNPPNSASRNRFTGRPALTYSAPSLPTSGASQHLSLQAAERAASVLESGGSSPQVTSAELLSRGSSGDPPPSWEYMDEYKADEPAGPNKMLTNLASREEGLWHVRTLQRSSSTSDSSWIQDFVCLPAALADNTSGQALSEMLATGTSLAGKEGERDSPVEHALLKGAGQHLAMNSHLLQDQNTLASKVRNVLHAPMHRTPVAAALKQPLHGLAAGSSLTTEQSSVRLEIDIPEPQDEADYAAASMDPRTLLTLDSLSVSGDSGLLFEMPRLHSSMPDIDQGESLCRRLAALFSEPHSSRPEASSPRSSGGLSTAQQHQNAASAKRSAELEGFFSTSPSAGSFSRSSLELAEPAEPGNSAATTQPSAAPIHLTARNAAEPAATLDAGNKSGTTKETQALSSSKFSSPEELHQSRVEPAEEQSLTDLDNANEDQEVGRRLHGVPTQQQATPQSAAQFAAEDTASSRLADIEASSCVKAELQPQQDTLQFRYVDRSFPAVPEETHALDPTEIGGVVSSSEAHQERARIVQVHFQAEPNATTAASLSERNLNFQQAPSLTMVAEEKDDGGEARKEQDGSKPKHSGQEAEAQAAGYQEAKAELSGRLDASLSTQQSDTPRAMADQQPSVLKRRPRFTYPKGTPEPSAEYPVPKPLPDTAGESFASSKEELVVPFIRAATAMPSSPDCPPFPAENSSLRIKLHPGSITPAAASPQSQADTPPAGPKTTSQGAGSEHLPTSLQGLASPKRDLLWVRGDSPVWRSADKLGSPLPSISSQRPQQDSHSIPSSESTPGRAEEHAYAKHGRQHKASGNTGQGNMQIASSPEGVAAAAVGVDTGSGGGGSSEDASSASLGGFDRMKRAISRALSSRRRAKQLRPGSQLPARGDGWALGIQELP